MVVWLSLAIIETYTNAFKPEFLLVLVEGFTDTKLWFHVHAKVFLKEQNNWVLS